MMTEWLVAARAVHFGACLLFFGVFAFDRFVAVALDSREASAPAAYWASQMRRLSAIALALILLTGLAWFALVAVSMSGQALSVAILQTVWNQTTFGTVAKFRLAFWIAGAAAIACHWFPSSRQTWRKELIWIGLIFGGLLLGSLAWAGHGQEGDPAGWHLCADVLHLLVAGLWPTGLLPFGLLLRQLRRTAEPARSRLIAAVLRRFSAISLGSVVMLSATGLINSWFLVGSVANLIRQPYGRWLLEKIVLFCLAAGIGAVNLLRLKPRLLMKNPPATAAQSDAARLQCNVWLELFIGLVIIIIVAILGLLPPAISAQG